MLKFRIRIATFGLLLLAVMLAGCHSVPLGDPEKSVADPSLAGWWLEEPSEKTPMLVYIMPYDPRTYVVTAYSYKIDGDTIKTEFKLTAETWMTSVGGMDVACLKIIDPEWDLVDGPEKAKRYIYFRIRKPDPATMEIRMLDIDFLKDTKTPEELAKRIADNVNNPDLFKGKGNDPILFKHVPDDKKDEVKKIVKAFEPKKA